MKKKRRSFLCDQWFGGTVADWMGKVCVLYWCAVCQSCAFFLNIWIIKRVQAEARISRSCSACVWTGLCPTSRQIQLCCSSWWGWRHCSEFTVCVTWLWLRPCEGLVFTTTFHHSWCHEWSLDGTAWWRDSTKQMSAYVTSSAVLASSHNWIYILSAGWLPPV